MHISSGQKLLLFGLMDLVSSVDTARALHRASCDRNQTFATQLATMEMAAYSVSSLIPPEAWVKNLVTEQLS